MANEKPLILKDGKITQMGSGDTIPPENISLSGITNLDGGLAASVYLNTQLLDGGGA